MEKLWESLWTCPKQAFGACNPDQIMPANGRNLLKRAEEFQSKQAGVANDLLAQNFGCDRRRFGGHEA